MAKYVLLSFDNDGDADNFVDQFQQGRVMIPVPHRKLEGQYSVVSNGSLEGQADIDGKHHHNFVRGVYKKPTIFHDSSCKAGKNTGFTRGKKYGWMVCAACGKPTQGWAKGDGWFSALGTNLLPLSQEAPEYRGIGKPGCFWNDDTKQWEPYSEGSEGITNILNAPGGSPVGIHVATPPTGKPRGWPQLH
jgi:hypothetical protein